MTATLIHLDSSFLINALRPGSREADELSRCMSLGMRIGISVIAWSEFLCGPLEVENRDFAARVVGVPEPFIAADAQMAADFFNVSGRRKGHLADCMIAATAMRLGAGLATTNPRDFQKMRGLVVNPEL